MCQNSSSKLNCLALIAVLNIILNLFNIRITGLGDGKDIYCHPKVNPEDESLGWCKTMGNFYDIDNPRENQPGWGFCGKDCFTDPVGG